MSESDVPDGRVGLTDRIRSTSVNSFQDLSNSVAAQAMRKELDKLVSKVQDQEKRKQFAKEMDNSYHLFTRYLAEKTKGKRLEWDKIASPNPDQVKSEPG